MVHIKKENLLKIIVKRNFKSHPPPPNKKEGTCKCKAPSEIILTLIAT